MNKYKNEKLSKISGFFIAKKWGNIRVFWTKIFRAQFYFFMIAPDWSIIHYLYDHLKEIGIHQNFSDLFKRFDTVNHSAFPKKLQMYGIRGINIAWVSYVPSKQKTVYFVRS